MKPFLLINVGSRRTAILLFVAQGGIRNISMLVVYKIGFIVFLDQLMGNHKWTEALQEKIKTLYEKYGCFERINSMADLPDTEFKYIPLFGCLT